MLNMRGNVCENEKLFGSKLYYRLLLVLSNKKKIFFFFLVNYRRLQLQKNKIKKKVLFTKSAKHPFFFKDKIATSYFVVVF